MSEIDIFISKFEQHTQEIIKDSQDKPNFNNRKRNLQRKMEILAKSIGKHVN